MDMECIGLNDNYRMMIYRCLISNNVLMEVIDAS